MTRVASITNSPQTVPSCDTRHRPAHSPTVLFCDKNRAYLRAAIHAFQSVNGLVPWHLASKLIVNNNPNSFIAKRHGDIRG